MIKHYSYRMFQSLFSNIRLAYSRAGWGPQTFFLTHGNQPPSLSGVHGLKDYLCSAHLHGSFDGRIYSLEHFHKSKFVQQRTQEGGHYRGNPWNHELLTVRGVDYRASKKMFWGVIPVYWPLKLWCSCSYLTLLSHVFSLGAPISACANKNFLLCLQNWIKIGIFRTVVKCIKSIPAPLSSGHVLQMQTFELLKYFSIKLNTAASNNNFRHFTESIEKL